MTRHIQTISLFPQMFSAILNESMMWKAQDRKVVQFTHHDLREFGLGPRRQVDDTPYGGGDGMLLKPEPLFAAIEKAKQIDPEALVCLMTPRGITWGQPQAESYAKDDKGLIFVCARYEGYDERITTLVDRQISIGNFVLTGGELPALTSIVRLMPGVLGGETSAQIESFSDGDNLEFPQYTRPAEFRGLIVPDVLLNGNHAEIAAWRKAQSDKQVNL